MSGNSSINGNKHYYQRLECWISERRNNKGELISGPLILNFSDKLSLGETKSPREKVMESLRTIPNQNWTKKEIIDL